MIEIQTTWLLQDLMKLVPSSLQTEKKLLYVVWMSIHFVVKSGDINYLFRLYGKFTVTCSQSLRFIQVPVVTFLFLSGFQMVASFIIPL